MERYFLFLPLFLAAVVFPCGALSRTEYYDAVPGIKAAEDWAGGEALFRKAVREYPEEVNFHCYLNEMLRRLEKNLEALEQIRPIYNQNRGNDFAFGCYKWSIIEYGLQKRDEEAAGEALGLLRQAYNLDSNDLTATLWYGILLRETGDTDLSIEILEQGIEKFDNQYIRDNLLYSRVEKANSIRIAAPVDAESLYKGALSLDGNNLTALLWYGIFLNEQARHQEALAVLDKALILYPDNEHLPGNINHAYFSLGKKLDEEGEHERAVTVYEEAAARFPDSLFYYYHLFNDYMKLKDYGRAERTLVRWCRAKAASGLTGEELFSEENNLYYRISELVKILIIRKDYQRAFDLYAELRPLFDNRHLLLNGEGELRWFSGEIEEGIAMINKAYDVYIEEHPEYLAPLYIDLPMKGTFFVAAGNNSPNVMTHAGPGRYCFDFMGSDENGNTVRPGTGGLGRNEDYYGFGMPVYSPVDGIVVSAEDEGVDHPPSDEWMYSLEGNHITIQDSNGFNYVFVHNRHGSALVKEGDRVSAGAQIAELGNTASSVPHLHFGVWTEDWTVSIPIRFKSYIEADGAERRNSVPAQGTVIINEE